MKKITFVLFLCMLLGWQSGKAADQANCQIVYVKEHHLYQQGDAMNVIDIDVEWPEYLHGQRIDSLQGRLQAVLFQHRAEKWQEAKEMFLKDYGTPVTKQLQIIPDDSKFCYISCQLQEIGLWEDRFVSFQTHVDIKPEKNSSIKEVHRSEILTYDLINQAFLKRDQILRMGRLTDNLNYSQVFSTLLLSHTPEPLSTMPASITLGETIGVGNNHLVVPFLAFGDEAEEHVTATAYIPLTSLNDFLTKDFQKRLAQTPKPGTIAMKNDQNSTVDEMPELLMPDIKRFVSQNMVLPAAWKKENGNNGRALFRYVLGEDKTIQEVCVMRPISPSVDRELVRVLRLLPWKAPAKHNGMPVSVGLYQVLNFKVQTEDSDNM